ncbi:MAG: YigZ family protein [Bacteroidales bacterium]|jgi:uncharacterized YigZ family protein|nr:YigZ family protein [Bacteroidales bacterium]
MDEYLTIETTSKAEYKEKRSRFIAFAFPVNDIQQVKPIIDDIKNKYFDARHHCFAYKINEGETINKRVFDDREPSHTAGDMIYSAIESKNITNILIVVVRYFGGTLLGASNLARAYRQAAIESINNATIITKTIEETIIFKFSYNVVSQVNKLLKENNFDKSSYSYQSDNIIKLSVKKSRKESIIKSLQTIFGIEIL